MNAKPYSDDHAINLALEAGFRGYRDNEHRKALLSMIRDSIDSHEEGLPWEVWLGQQLTRTIRDTPGKGADT